MTFPQQLKPSQATQEARQIRRSELIASIKRGIIARLLIIGAELLGFLFLSSFALLYDAVASLWDILSSVALIFAISLASRPPDEDHPFGHGRYEPLTGLQLALLMVGLGLFMSYKQVVEIATQPAGEELYAFTWMIPVGAVILLEGCYQWMMRASRKHKSAALAADAVHFRIDAVNSLLAAVALFVGSFFPSWSPFFDHMGAFIISALMIFIGLSAAYKNVHQIIDRVPDKEIFVMIRKAAEEVPGVLGTEKLRVQLTGPDAHIDIDVEVEPNLSVVEAHRISQEVRVAIQEKWPMTRDVIVHIEPYYPDDHDA